MNHRYLMLRLVAVWVLIFAGTSLAQTSQPGGAESSAKIRVLILDGFSNHNWQLNTRLLRGLLEPTGLFEVKVSTCPPLTAADRDKWLPDFSKADVVIQTCNDISQRPAPKWPEPVKTAFVDFVKNGGGVLVFHSGNNAFPDWPEYNDIIGLGWRPVSYGTALQVLEDGTIKRLAPGEGRATSHAPRAEVLVHQLGEHPIHAGMPRTWRSPALEVYYDARGPANNVEVLSYGQDPRFKEYWPLEWTVKYGQGRVYASSFGHVWSDESETKQPVDLLAIDEQILIQRTIQWLAKKPITVKIPDNFPTAEKISLSENIPLPKE
jgi:type 1 glutamine amidotransferase